MEPVRMLLVDDHALFREGLALILNAEPDFKVVGEAADGAAALNEARRLQPDLILMDVSMPGGDGMEATRRIKRALPDVVVVMLTGQKEQEKMVEALLAGADGYLLKSMHSVEMLALLRGALGGEALIPSSLASHTLEAYRRLSRGSRADKERLRTLTPREQEIVRMVGKGASNKQIAQALQLSVHTVKTHIRHILTKLHVERRREIDTYAHQLDQDASSEKE